MLVGASDEFPRTLRAVEDGSGLWHTETLHANLDRPYFAAATSRGNLVVSDCMNHRVLLLSADGHVLREFEPARCPMGVACAADATSLYVVAMAAPTRLLKISLADGARFGSIEKWREPQREGSSEGVTWGSLRSPQGVAALGTTVFVADTGANRVCVFDDWDELCFSFAFGRAGAGDGEFCGPTGVAASYVTREIFVSDRYNHRVCVFDAHGGWRRVIGGRGSLPGLFNEPFGVVLGADKSLFVSEYLGTRVQQLTLAGMPLRVCSCESFAGVRWDGGWLGGLCEWRGGLCALEPKGNRLHQLAHATRAGLSLQRRCLDVLLRQCEAESEWRSLLEQLREHNVAIAM
jgi:DNA-binding beta-propeller fold protein YncE